MSVDRRAFLAAAASVLVSQTLAAKSVEENGLFWTAAREGKPKSVLFGYARCAASVAPTVVSDGRKFALLTRKLINDVPNFDIREPETPVDKIPSIYDRVPSALGDRIRTYVKGTVGKFPDNLRLTGLFLSILLQGEGQTPPQPTVGGTIAENAVAAGEPISYLLTKDEYTTAYRPPDLAALDERVTPDVLDYLFKLRELVGPIGKRQESLYAARQVGELARLNDDLKAHGVWSFADVSGLPVERIGNRIVERSLAALQSADQPSMLLLPVGLLTQDNGVLAKARAAGFTVSALG